MTSATYPRPLETAGALCPPPPPAFPPLDQETRPTVSTAAAAYYLDRKMQTLHIWACKENGPIRPVRVHGRLAWPVAEIRRVLGVEG